MALPNKPSIKNVWATSGLKVEPSDTKVNTGWIVERPPHQFQNFLQNRSDQFLKHINEAGIPVWDAVTIYTAGKSYVQGSDGLLYKAKTTGANQDPVGNPTNWMLTLGETDFQEVVQQTEDNALAAANSASEAATSEANALATVPVFDDVAPTPNLAGKQWTSALTGKRYEWIVDADSGQWVEMGPQTTFGATAFAETLSADDGATKVGTPEGTVQDALDVRPTEVALAASDASAGFGFKQNGTGAVDSNVQAELRLKVHAFQFGAKGDNVTDDTVALNVLGIFAALYKFTAEIPPTSTGYKTTDTVTFPVGANLEMTGASIKYAGPKDRPALVLGTLGALNLRPVYTGISVEQVGTLSWPSMSHVGVRCINAIRARIDIRYIAGFTANWECYSDNQGYSYNTHLIQELLNSKYQMVLRTVGAAVNGNFVNENTFIGGRYGCDSSTNALGSRYGVLLTWDKVSSYRGQNANKWLYPCFELGNPTTGESIPLHFDGAGGYNRVVEARRESGIGPFARLDGGSSAFMNVTNNSFSVLYGASVNVGFIRGIEEINGANGNIIEDSNLLKRDPISWSSGKIVDQISGYGTNRPYISGPLFFITNATPTPSKWLDSSFIKTFKDEVYLINGVGVGTVLDTTKVKRFNLALAARGTLGRICIKCFDSSNQVLIPGSTTDPYVMVPGNQMSTNSNFGGNCYTYASDGATGEISITLANVVKKVWIIFCGGTNPVLLESFMIQGFPDLQNSSGAFVYAPMTISSGIPGSDTQLFARAKPDTEAQHGVYKRGQTVFNAVAAVGTPSHWTTITNDIGYLNKPWVVSTLYAYTDEIVINGANAYICKTTGTSAASGGPTGTGTSISDGTVVWDYLGPKAVFAASPNLV